MELIERFNTSLYSLYNDKLPVSKAKISEITRAAIDGVRVHKHIVLSVERFIHKCQPEYKLPALYVIDSIVRHSQHEFRSRERDVYGQRFNRNLTQTFQVLFATCLADDKPKIVRVLNLWQKNNVFSPDVIQPLLDLAAAPAGVCDFTGTTGSSSSSSTIIKRASPATAIASNQILSKSDGPNVVRMITEASAAVNSIRQFAHNHQSGGGQTVLANQLQQLVASLTQFQENKTRQMDIGQPDFDLSPDPDDIDDDISTPTEAEPPYPKPSKLLKKFGAQSGKTFNSFADLMQMLQQQQQKSNDQQQQNKSDSNQMLDMQSSNGMTNDLAQETILQKFLNSNIGPPPPPPEISNHDHDRSDYGYCYQHQQHTAFETPVSASEMMPNDHHSETASRRSKRSRSRTPSPRDRNRRSSSRHRYRDCGRSRYSSSSRHRSPDDNNDRRRRGSRSRSRSNSPNAAAAAATEAEREKERERRRKGYPPIRKDRMTICSTTLWIGHLPKRLTSESDLHDLFGEFGIIASIDLIPSRGCAYVCMDRRQDAHRAFAKIKSQPKILGSTQVKLTWAPGKGVKNKEYKEHWESDVGCSFIPYSAITDDVDLDQLEEGGVIDEESIPERAKEIRARRQQEKKLQEEQLKQQQAQNSTAAVYPMIPPLGTYPVAAPGAPPLPPPPIPPPVAVAPPLLVRPPMIYPPPPGVPPPVGGGFPPPPGVPPPVGAGFPPPPPPPPPMMGHHPGLLPPPPPLPQINHWVPGGVPPPRPVHVPVSGPPPPPPPMIPSMMARPPPPPPLPALLPLPPPPPLSVPPNHLPPMSLPPKQQQQDHNQDCPTEEPDSRNEESPVEAKSEMPPEEEKAENFDESDPNGEQEPEDHDPSDNGNWEMNHHQNHRNRIFSNGGRFSNNNQPNRNLNSFNPHEPQFSPLPPPPPPHGRFAPPPPPVLQDDPFAPSMYELKSMTTCEYPGQGPPPPLPPPPHHHPGTRPMMGGPPPPPPHFGPPLPPPPRFGGRGFPHLPPPPFGDDRMAPPGFNQANHHHHHPQGPPLMNTRGGDGHFRNPPGRFPGIPPPPLPPQRYGGGWGPPPPLPMGFHSNANHNNNVRHNRNNRKFQQQHRFSNQFKWLPPPPLPLQSHQQPMDRNGQKNNGDQPPSEEEIEADVVCQSQAQDNNGANVANDGDDNAPTTATDAGTIEEAVMASEDSS